MILNVTQKTLNEILNVIQKHFNAILNVIKRSLAVIQMPIQIKSSKFLSIILAEQKIMP